MTGKYDVPGSSDGPADTMIFANGNYEPFQIVSREECLSRAKANVQYFTRNYEECLLHPSAISCTNNVTKYSEFIVRFIEFLHIPASSSSQHAQTCTNSSPVTLTYGTKKSLELELTVSQNVLRLTPVVALCVQPNSIYLCFSVNVSQVAYCCICPLIAWPCVQTHDQLQMAWQGYDPAPVDCVCWFVATSRK